MKKRVLALLAVFAFSTASADSEVGMTGDALMGTVGLQYKF